MQVFPGDAFLNTVSGTAARPATPQPAPDPQSRVPANAVKAAGRAQEAVDGKQQKSPPRPAPAPAQAGRPAGVPANAPRGTFVNLLV